MCVDHSLAQNTHSYDFSSNHLKINIPENKPVSEFSVYRGHYNLDQTRTINPILGKIKRTKDSLIFTPLVPFSKISKYTFVVDQDIYYCEPALPEDYTFLMVDHVFPSKTHWPSNTLKFHIAFNKPVNTTNIYDHISVLDDQGNKLNRILLDLGQAITDAQQTLVTIWIEPGRQKRDLGPNIILGPPFEINKSYKLVIDSSLKDKSGVPMAKKRIKEIVIVEPDRIQPNPEKWNLKIPHRNSLEPLIIYPDEVLDYKSALSGINIINPSKEVQGILSYNDEQSFITFHPDLPWKKGNYIVEINPDIEDLSGNSPRRLFDNDLNKITPEEVIKDFNLKFKVE